MPGSSSVVSLSTSCFPSEPKRSQNALLVFQGESGKWRAVADRRARITDVSEDATIPEPPPIRQLSAPELKALLEGGTALELVDVRTPWERRLAKIDGSCLLDHSHHDTLIRLDRSTPIVFQCHHGIRSQQAAEYFRREGFRELYNLQGGIDAWSQLVDPEVPRY